MFRKPSARSQHQPPRDRVTEMQPRPQPQRPGRLSSYKFADMYISADPLQPIMIRGLRPAAQGMGNFGRGLKRIPDEISDDVLKLYEAIGRKWRHSDYLRDFRITYDDQPYRCSLIAPPSFTWEEDGGTGGVEVKWCVRQMQREIPALADLGLPQATMEDLSQLRAKRGLVLISGSFASGKTTLASTTFNHWVTESREFGIALEDPPELPLAKMTEDEGIIVQHDLQDRSVQQAIKNSKRWAPRYVFLGEIRTSDVTAELLHMAIAGPLAICTIHGSDAVQAIVSLFRFAAAEMSEQTARDMIAASLKQVFHQEIIGGRARITSANIEGPETHLILSKIKSGNFKGLYEDFERQSINRSGS